MFSMVPGPGLEPGQPEGHKILSLARLPNSATPALEWGEMPPHGASPAVGNNVYSRCKAILQGRNREIL